MGRLRVVLVLGSWCVLTLVMSAITSGCTEETAPATVASAVAPTPTSDPPEAVGLFVAHDPVTDRYGFIDRTGAWVISPQFVWATAFSEGLASVVTDQGPGHTGFIDTTGSFVIEPTLCTAAEFKEGLAQAALQVDEQTLQTGFIDKTGEMVVGPFDPDLWGAVAPFFSEGMCAATGPDGKWGYIDKTGTWAIQPAFLEAAPFSNGLALIEDEDGRGFIDRTGAMAIQPRFQVARSFHEGLAAVYVDGKWGYIDTTGAMVIEPQFDRNGDFSEGLCHQRLDDRSGYIDRSGTWVIPPRFDLANDFSEGLAACAVPSNGNLLTGYIDQTGTWVIPPQFDPGAQPFSDGLALVYIGGRDPSHLAYIDRSGAVVWRATPSP